MSAAVKARLQAKRQANEIAQQQEAAAAPADQSAPEPNGTVPPAGSAPESDGPVAVAPGLDMRNITGVNAPGPDGAPARDITKFYHVTDKTPVGSGNFGHVYRGVETATGAWVAIKAILKRRLGQQKQGEQLRREVDMMRRMRSDYVVRLLDLFEDEHYVYLIMEYMAGEELFTRIKRIYPHGYPEQFASAIARRILLGVAHMHERSIAHRDLKPENVLFASPHNDVDVKIADFGLARLIEDELVVKTSCGSPSYVAPEVLQQEKTNTGYGCAADVWSVGVICYVLLCGYLPFYHKHMPTMFELICAGRYEPPQRASPLAQDFLAHLLVVDPRQRWAAVDALRHPWIDPAAGPQSTGHVAGVANPQAPPQPMAPPAALAAPAGVPAVSLVQPGATARHPAAGQ